MSPEQILAGFRECLVCPSELPLGISVLCLQCGSLRTFVY